MIRLFNETVMSNQNCSVFGCGMTGKKAKKTGKPVIFYCFPSRPWQQDRRQAWIRFTKRKNHDGSQWLPTKNSRICSQHFVGEVKSEHPAHPNFMPTIFKVHTNEPVKVKDVSRFNRALKRNLNSGRANNRVKHSTDEIQNQIRNSTADEENDLPIHEVLDSPKLVDRAIQVKPELIDIEINPTLEKRTFRTPTFQGYQSIKDNESALHDLTAVSCDVFSLLLSLLPRMVTKCNSLSMEDKLLLTLMKLKGGSGLPYSTLAVLFGEDARRVSSSFQFVINNLYNITLNWIFFPSKETVLETMPNVFKENYNSCRIIIDCTEMKTETPSQVDQKIHMYSNYKGSYTAKYLIGITPGGFISFISKGYGGRATDSFITNDCGVLDLLESGDTIMADKGFPHVNVNDGVIVVMPPFSKGKQVQFSSDEVDQTYKIASLRIHVERSIQRVKIFTILSTTVPWNILPILDKVVHVC